MAESSELVQQAERLDTGERVLYGLVAEFEDAHEVVEAARRTRDAGYRKIDAYTPFPVEELSEALGHRDIYVPMIMLAAGILGGIGGFAGLTYLTVQEYPLNIGGRPLFAWPSFVPITFELIVLLSALSGIVGMFWLNGLPQPYHPVFDTPNFEHATSSRFFLSIEADDPKFDREETLRFMESLGAANVSAVEQRKSL